MWWIAILVALPIYTVLLLAIGACGGASWVSKKYLTEHRHPSELQSISVVSTRPATEPLLPAPSPKTKTPTTKKHQQAPPPAPTKKLSSSSSSSNTKTKTKPKITKRQQEEEDDDEFDDMI